MKIGQRIAITYTRAKFKLLSSISKKKAAQAAFELFKTPQSRSRKPLPEIFEQAEELRFSLDSRTIHGWRWNHPSGNKALILHGMESSAVNFDRYIRPLIQKGYEVLAFDAPAHGRSDGKIITAPDYRKMIMAIQEQFGPIKSFMAHSFGGLALCLAMEELDHGPDYRIGLIAPATETTTALNSYFRFLKLNGAVRTEFEKLIIREGGVPSSWYSIRRAMKRIKARVLWIHDEDDHITPLSDVFRVRSDNHAHIRFMITKGLGHRRIYRDPKVVQAMIDFL